MSVQKETVNNNSEYSVLNCAKRVRKHPKKFDKFELNKDILQLAENAAFPSSVYLLQSVNAENDEFWK